jgi:hypothetical protein
MDKRDFAIIALIFIFSCGFTAYGVFCTFWPRKAILLQAQFSSLVNEESAQDRRVVFPCRVMGVVFVIGGAFFILVALVKLGF